MTKRNSNRTNSAAQQYWNNVGTGAAVVGEATLIAGAAAVMAPAILSWWAISAVTGTDGPFDRK